MKNEKELAESAFVPENTEHPIELCFPFPPEITQIILSHLDDRSLIQAEFVNHVWLDLVSELLLKRESEAARRWRERVFLWFSSKKTWKPWGGGSKSILKAHRGSVESKLKLIDYLSHERGYLSRNSVSFLEFLAKSNYFFEDVFYILFKRLQKNAFYEDSVSMILDLIKGVDGQPDILKHPSMRLTWYSVQQIVVKTFPDLTPSQARRVFSDLITRECRASVESSALDSLCWKLTHDQMQAVWPEMLRLCDSDDLKIQKAGLQALQCTMKLDSVHLQNLNLTVDQIKEALQRLVNVYAKGWEEHQRFLVSLCRIHKALRIEQVLCLCTEVLGWTTSDHDNIRWAALEVLYSILRGLISNHADIKEEIFFEKVFQTVIGSCHSTHERVQQAAVKVICGISSHLREEQRDQLSFYLMKKAFDTIFESWKSSKDLQEEVFSSQSIEIFKRFPLSEKILQWEFTLELCRSHDRRVRDMACVLLPLMAGALSLRFDQIKQIIPSVTCLFDCDVNVDTSREAVLGVLEQIFSNASSCDPLIQAEAKGFLLKRWGWVGWMGNDSIKEGNRFGLCGLSIHDLRAFKTIARAIPRWKEWMEESSFQAMMTLLSTPYLNEKLRIFVSIALKGILESDDKRHPMDVILEKVNFADETMWPAFVKLLIEMGPCLNANQVQSMSDRLIDLLIRIQKKISSIQINQQKPDDPSVETKDSAVRGDVLLALKKMSISFSLNLTFEQSKVVFFEVFQTHSLLERFKRERSLCLLVGLHHGLTFVQLKAILIENAGLFKKGEDLTFLKDFFREILKSSVKLEAAGSSEDALGQFARLYHLDELKLPLGMTPQKLALTALSHALSLDQLNLTDPQCDALIGWLLEQWKLKDFEIQNSILTLFDLIIGSLSKNPAKNRFLNAFHEFFPIEQPELQKKTLNILSHIYTRSRGKLDLETVIDTIIQFLSNEHEDVYQEAWKVLSDFYKRSSLTPVQLETIMNHISKRMEKHQDGMWKYNKADWNFLDKVFPYLTDDQVEKLFPSSKLAAYLSERMAARCSPCSTLASKENDNEGWPLAVWGKLFIHFSRQTDSLCFSDHISGKLFCAMIFSEIQQRCESIILDAPLLEDLRALKDIFSFSNLDQRKWIFDKMMNAFLLNDKFFDFRSPCAWSLVSEVFVYLPSSQIEVELPKIMDFLDQRHPSALRICALKFLGDVLIHARCFKLNSLGERILTEIIRAGNVNGEKLGELYFLKLVLKRLRDISAQIQFSERELEIMIPTIIPLWNYEVNVNEWTLSGSVRDHLKMIKKVQILISDLWSYGSPLFERYLQWDINQDDVSSKGSPRRKLLFSFPSRSKLLTAPLPIESDAIQNLEPVKESSVPRPF